jgi:hypothetical protein
MSDVRCSVANVPVALFLVACTCPPTEFQGRCIVIVMRSGNIGTPQSLDADLQAQISVLQDTVDNYLYVIGIRRGEMQ